MLQMILLTNRSFRFHLTCSLLIQQQLCSANIWNIFWSSVIISILWISILYNFFKQTLLLGTRPDNIKTFPTCQRVVTPILQTDPAVLTPLPLSVLLQPKTKTLTCRLTPQVHPHKHTLTQNCCFLISCFSISALTLILVLFQPAATFFLSFQLTLKSFFCHRQFCLYSLLTLRFYLCWCIIMHFICVMFLKLQRGLDKWNTHWTDSNGVNFSFLFIENGDNSDCCAGAAGPPGTHNRVVSGN